MPEPGSHLERGLEAFKASDLDTAILELEQATRDDPENYRAFTYLGAAYAGKGKYNAAIGALKHSEQLHPNVASIHYNIAQVYEAAGVPDEAEYEYEFALQIDPNYTKAAEALAAMRNRRRHDTNSSDE